MEFTEQDRDALYNTWMSQKAKLRLTQMEVAKKLDLTLAEFSDRLRGEQPLDLHFIEKFCHELHVEPNTVLPSLKAGAGVSAQAVNLQTRIKVSGQVQSVHFEGDEVIINYRHEG